MNWVEGYTENQKFIIFIIIIIIARSSSPPHNLSFGPYTSLSTRE